jgi:shikimate dehydrogenase
VSITGRTRLAGVIGWPVSHSRSPRLHNEWLRRAAIDGAYLPLPVAPGRLEDALRGLQAAGFRGVNVTIPHKEDAFRLCAGAPHALTDAARRCGSVNTITFDEDGRWHGDSTDGDGFLDSLRAEGVRPEAGLALLLGAGGSARAIAAALQRCGVPVSLAARRPEQAQALADALNATRGDAPAIAMCRWEDRDGALAERRLLVNTTPLGMEGKESAPPIDLAAAPAGLVVADIVYVPRLTPLLADAERRNLRTVGGIGMLAFQARIGFTRWFGAEPAVDEALLSWLLQPEPGA